MIDILLIILWVLLGIVAVAFALLLIFCIVAVICSLLVDKTKFYKKDNAFYRFLLDVIAWFAVTFTNVKIHTTGIEKIPTKQRFLLICNHRSSFDPIVTYKVLKKYKVGFISKVENFSIPVMGGISRRCSFVEIDRQLPKNALKTIIHAAEMISSDEVSYVVYPEGTRSSSGELLPFHDAVFKIATKAKCPIVVCSISGSEKVKGNLPFKRTHVFLDVLEVIPTEQVEKMRTCEIGEYTKNLIQQNLKTIEE